MLGGKLTIEGVSVGLSERLAVSVNKSIADVREPENRNCDFTKTLKIPATPEVNALFEWAYDVNIDFQSFNPNKSTPGSYFLNTTEVIRGNIQLLAIPQLYNHGFYEIVIRGTNADLFIMMEELYLTDLSFTDLNHTLDYTNFSSAPTIGVGYCYGYIDYGMNGVRGNTWSVLHFKAAIWLKEYVDRIFTLLGLTYTSSIITSTFFKSIAVPCIKEGAYQFTPTQINNRQFYAKKTTTQARNGGFVNGRSSPFPAGYQYHDFTSITPIIFNDDSTSPLHDVGGIYNTATGEYTTTTVVQSGIKFILNYDVRLTIPSDALATALTFSGESNLQICIRRNGIVVSTSGINAPMLLTKSGSDMVGSLSTSVIYNTGLDPIGTVYDCCVVPQTGAESSSGGFITNSSMFNGNFKDSGGSSVGSVLPSFPASTYTVTSAYFFNLLQNQNLYWGDTIDMNTVVPEDVKMLDFFNWVVKKFNLYIEQDKDNPLNYIIERRDDFYLTSNPLDLNPLWDNSEDFIVLPMGELDAKSYLVRDKQDADYWNKLYQDKYKQVYGQQLLNIDNDFVTGAKIIETGFSPSPGVAFQTDIVAPRFLQIDGSFPGGGAYTVKPIKVNPRLLYWGGIKNCDLHNLITSATSGLVPVNTYPSLNHVDDAQSPTVDLNFSAPIEVFWKKPAQVWTTNTQYNVGYKKFLTEISDPNSKIVQMYAMLTQDQIYRFTFRRLVYWKGALFYVNKFENDDIQSGGATMLELLKLNPAAAVEIIQYDPYDPPSGQGRLSFTNPEYTDRGNYGNYDNANIGRNLNNGAGIGLMVGENVQVDRAVQRFTGLGIKDQIIGLEMEGMVKITEGMVISDNGIELDKKAREVYTADFDVVKTLSYVDASGGNITATLPGIDFEGTLTIVRVDNSANTVTIKGSTGFEDLNTNGASSTAYLQPGNTTNSFNSNLTAWYY